MPSAWAATASTASPPQPRRSAAKALRWAPVHPAALGTPYSQVFLLLLLDTKPGRVKRAR